MHACTIAYQLAFMHAHAYTRARAHTHTHEHRDRHTQTNTQILTHARTHRCILSWRLLGKCWVHLPWKCSGFRTKKRGISSCASARAHTHTHTHTHRYVCRGYRSQDKGFLLEGALQHVLVPQGRGRGVLRVDVGVLCVDLGRAGGRKLGTNTHAQGIMHAHGRTYVNTYIHTYIHTYIYIYIERERERYI